jgi:hypothetical protein
VENVMVGSRTQSTKVISMCPVPGTAKLQIVSSR